MRPIATLTINPAIDAFCRNDRVIPVRKVRTRAEHYVPGGGGLNVSPVIRELGGATVAFYLAGGLTGQALALEVVHGGGAEIVALTLGAEGAILATRGGAIRLAAPKVETRSAVGAGDAFLGAMMHAVISGQPLPQAFALGVAAGAATAAVSGTALAARAQILALLPEVTAQLAGASRAGT